MPKRFLGNIMTDAPTAPAGPYQDSAASGVWSLAEALSYTKGGLWPTAGNVLEIALFTGSRLEIDKVLIQTLGNATDFGNCSQERNNLAACSSSTRGVFGGGAASGTDVTTIDFVTFSTEANAIDFGDLTTATERMAGCSSSTRGLFMGGNTGSKTNTIQYITIATAGNATDFGDLLNQQEYNAGFSSSTRGVCSGGEASSRLNVIQYVTIASAGNATDLAILLLPDTVPQVCQMQPED